MIFLSFFNLELSQTAESSRLACSETCTSLQLLVMERGKKTEALVWKGCTNWKETLTDYSRHNFPIHQSHCRDLSVCPN